MWDYILAVLVGAAIPTFINWLQRRDDRKKFELERKDKYKLVAIEKRLEAHQQAFYHWNKLTTIIHEKDPNKREEVMNNAREFYYNNALYLEKKTRLEFYNTISRVSNYPTTLEIWREYEQEPEKKEAHKNLLNDYNSIRNLGNIIQSDVNLEPINMTFNQTAEGHIAKEQ